MEKVGDEVIFVTWVNTYLKYVNLFLQLEQIQKIYNQYKVTAFLWVFL